MISPEPFSFDDCENICTSSYYHHQIGNIQIVGWFISHCLWLGHETMVCSACFTRVHTSKFKMGFWDRTAFGKWGSFGKTSIPETMLIEFQMLKYWVLGPNIFWIIRSCLETLKNCRFFFISANPVLSYSYVTNRNTISVWPKHTE